MTALWTAEAIANATGGTASAPFSVHGVAFDSREVQPGDLFVAMRGELTDGHLFIEKAIAAGASGVLCETPINAPHVLVPDAAVALVALGKAARARCSGQIIGVTGSVGKTGTKEALFVALDRHRPGRAHRSVKSYNNHTGVPLSLARMPGRSAYGVFEMGMNHAGEIEVLTQQVRPHVAVITAIAPAHIENLGTIEAIADAKAEIFMGLEPGGTAILPFDSPHYPRLCAAAEKQGARIVSFGLTEGADVRALDWLDDGHGGTLVTAAVGDHILCFTLSQSGEHWVANSMAVLAAVRAAGGDLPAAGLALAEMAGLTGRGARHRIARGDGELLLIDESYNANPASMEATLAILAREEGERRIAVLGAMKELGENSPHFHAELAGPVMQNNVDFALLVGAEMEPLAKALEGCVDFAHVPDAAGAEAILGPMTRAGDIVLIKGSNSVGLSRLVTAMTGGES
jgi:UDP-N-acetylmuramoyl-tripeptide--D-alanyl-D-alanine ligase